MISEAAKSCLSNANVVIDEVDMIINTGLYSENHLTEPAKAALIQNSLNGKYQSLEEEWEEAGNIFSFDLNNGAGGLINALQVIDGFIETGEVENGLIVTGDVKPLTEVDETRGFKNGAAAVLVSKNSKKKGFVHFKTETFTEFIDDVKSTTNWDTGKFRFIKNRNKHYVSHCEECIKKTIHSFFTEQDLSWNDFDIICTSQIPERFTEQLTIHLSKEGKVIQINDDNETYSAGLLFSLKNIFQTPEFSNAGNILFLTVSPGITVSLAHYKNEQ